MKVSEAINKLKEILDIYGDLTLEVDHDELIMTLSIEDIQAGNAYTGKIKYAYIYPETSDIHETIEKAKEFGYEEAKRKL